MATPASSDVWAVFNREAASWQGNYGPKGKFNKRLERFAARLSELSPPPGRILDFGCGTGEIAAAMDHMGYQVTGCDIAERMIEIARSSHGGTATKWICLKPDWEALPFGDCSFDGVVASSVFEYLVDVQRVAAEVSRVLRPGGVLLLTVPNPFNLVRKLEAWLWSAVSSRLLAPLVHRVQRIDSYATYLRLSRNRFRGDWWKSVLSRAHFAAFDERDFSEDAWLRQARQPLILLAMKRAATDEYQPT
jgi:2-polyprenyl-6-hydroxyphenyl methylase/3-demethylubiquinone-9 3-methyltransferase